MDSEEMHEQRHELIKIYNDLTLPLQKQLLVAARIIATTRELVLSEGNKTCVEKESKWKAPAPTIDTNEHSTI